MRKLQEFVQDALAGYEPALVRSIAVAVFVLLAAFGIGSGALPAHAEALLTFLAFIVPILGGYLIRQKVTPAKSVVTVPVDTSGDDSDASEADEPADYPEPDPTDQPKG